MTRIVVPCVGSGTLLKSRKIGWQPRVSANDPFRYHREFKNQAESPLRAVSISDRPQLATDRMFTARFTGSPDLAGQLFLFGWQGGYLDQRQVRLTVVLMQQATRQSNQEGETGPGLSSAQVSMGGVSPRELFVFLPGQPLESEDFNQQWIDGLVFKAMSDERAGGGNLAKWEEFTQRPDIPPRLRQTILSGSPID